MPKQKVVKGGPHRGSPRGVQHTVSRFWASDRGLGVFLWLLVGTLFVFKPLEDFDVLPGVLLGVMFALVAMSGVLAMTSSSRLKATFLAFAVVGIVFSYIRHTRPGTTIVLASLAVDLTWLGIVCGVVMQQVFRTGPITWHRIEGAIVVYVVFGVMCADVFRTMHTLDPMAFNLNGQPLAPTTHESVFNYFSFTTLTTVGYGDIAPANPLARAMANFEALAGQVYLATLISRLVSMGRAERS